MCILFNTIAADYSRVKRITRNTHFFPKESSNDTFNGQPKHQPRILRYITVSALLLYTSVYTCYFLSWESDSNKKSYSASCHRLRGSLSGEHLNEPMFLLIH